jgi:uncharacterized iron-regulated membrane protein
MQQSCFTAAERDPQPQFRNPVRYCELLATSYELPMSPTFVRLRSLWFQLHKWLGLCLAILIIPVSLSGAAIVWHDWLDEQMNPQRYPAAGAAALPPSAYAASALRLAQPGERIAFISFPGDKGSVQATLTRPVDGRPVRAWVWMDPKTAEPIERATTRNGVLRVLHILHGSLMIPGVGRQIVGWVGVAMLVSSLTGLWLWWPLKGSFRRGLRWNRRPDFNSNLHHTGGFWIALPLAALSFTGVWISFPAVFSGGLSGPLMPPRYMEQPGLTADQALAAAQPLAEGRVASIAWPTESKPEWTVTIKGSGKAREVKVTDAGARASLVPPKPETLARTMRRIHDGTGMPFAWQVVIFLGGILPALLAMTGILMWLRMRRRRQRYRLSTAELVEAEALAG